MFEVIALVIDVSLMIRLAAADGPCVLTYSNFQAAMVEIKSQQQPFLSIECSQLVFSSLNGPISDQAGANVITFFRCCKVIG